MLREFASLLIKRSSGCCLLHGPFAIPPKVALARVLSCWGSRLSWTAQRELAAQVIKGVENHKADVAFTRTATVRTVPSTVPRTMNGQRGGEVLTAVREDMLTARGRAS